MPVNEEDDEIEENIPTFEEEKELSVESILNTLTHRQTKDAAPSESSALGAPDEARNLELLADLPKVRRSVHVHWEENSYLPLQLKDY